ncbi:hypothetical protein D3C71_1273490 [compost metagenome]
MVDRDIFLSFKRWFDVLADKMFTQQGIVRVGITHALHIGNDSEEQIVAAGDRVSDRLNWTVFRRELQTAFHVGAVGQRAGDGERGVLYAIAGRAGNLHKVERKNDQ